jgi:DNA-binding CsgD family transcriptional regulator
MPAISDEKILSVIGSFYEAARTATSMAWQDAYAKLAKIFASGVGGFAIYDANTRCFRELITTLKPEHLTEFLDYYQYITPLRLKVAALKAGERINRAEQISDEDFTSTEIYRSFYSKVGVFNFELRVFCAGSHMRGIVVLSRPEGRPNYDRAELRAMSLIMPHLERAFDIYVALGGTNLENALVKDAIDRLARNVLVVDPGMSVVFANNAARDLLGQKDGLELSDDGRIRASFAGEDTALKKAAEAARFSDAEGSEQAVRVSRPSGLRQLELLFVRYPQVHLQIISPGPLTMVFISDPDHNEEASERILRRIYGLTTAEARIAVMLALGNDINEICDKLAITQNTARTHLKRIFSKTETNRQTDLVRLILGGPASIRRNTVNPTSQA